MRITDLHVDGFGIWNQMPLRGLSHRVTLVFGANETGKTTLLQFLRSVLYGFAPERRGRYLPPVHGGRGGGILDLETNRGRVRILRHVDQPEGVGGGERVVLQDPDGRVLTMALLDQLLMGVDEPTFNNVFAVGLRELQELGTLDDTKAADLLYKLTTGLDRVSLVDVMRQLAAARGQLWDPATSSGRIVDLRARQDHLRRRADELAHQGGTWMELEAQSMALVERAAEWERQIGQWDHDGVVVEAALQVHDLWCRRGVLHRQLESIGSVQEIPDASVERVEQLRESLDQWRADVERLARRRRGLRQELADLPLNEPLWSQAARIEALAEHGPWIASLQSQIEHLRGEIDTVERGLEPSRVAAAGPQSMGSRASAPASRLLATLRGPARALREDGERVKQAREEAELARLQWEESTTQLETALLEQGCERLSESVDETGALVGRLRRRVHLRQRLDEMARQREELQRHQGQLLDGQVLSLTALAWLGVPFVVGVMMVLAGVVWSTAGLLGWPVAVLGLAGWGLSVVAKVTMERSARRELVHGERQLELLQAQIRQAQQERDELDAQLPRGGASRDMRLADAEKKLARLEQLLPREAELQALRQRAQSAQRKLEQLEAAHKESRARWRGALRRAELPEDLSPQAVRHWAAGNERTEQTRRQAQRQREELETRQDELAALLRRVEEVMRLAKLSPAGSDPQVQLKQLAGALAEQQVRHQRRLKLRGEDRQLRREIQQVLRELRRARTQHHAILAAAGAADEKQLRAMVQRRDQYRAAQREWDAIEQQFRLTLGDRCAFEDVEQLLIDHDQEALRQRRQRLASRLAESRAELAAIHQQRGEVVQQARALVADRQWVETQLELGCIARQLDDAARRWRVLAVAARVLDAVRELYETQRQPQTLQDASRYFQALTDGQYVRIWTPLSDMSLRVDSASGESLPLDVLSCGTREAVFLSLRLALVADFARRGVVLPLILDDVLVNFDHRRAQAAARVLCDFADSGYQVLLFTCHEHIVRLFAAAGVEIRYLSPIVSEIPVVPEATADEQRIADEEAEFEEEEEEEEEEYEVEDAEESEERDEQFVLRDDGGEPEQAEYELADEEPVPDLNALDGLLQRDVLDEDDASEEPVEDDDWDEPPDAMPEADVRTDREEARHGDLRGQRFTWESPERWWDDYHTGGAAA